MVVFANNLQVMTLAQLIKDLIDTSKERIKTPISGAFLCSFVFWNWQPILLLLFSNQSIEDRIQIIDEYFYKPSAVFLPILISFFYLIIIPAIMIVIDWILQPIKKQRIGRIYKSKEFVLDEKIKLAGKELELKNAESENKQIEEFQKQIQLLEDSKNQIVESSNNTINQLNIKLKEANDALSNIVQFEIDNSNLSDEKMVSVSDIELRDRLVKAKLLKRNLTSKEIEQIISIKRWGEGTENYTQIDSNLLSKLSKAKLLFLDGSKKILTEDGERYINYLKT